MRMNKKQKKYQLIVTLVGICILAAIVAIGCGSTSDTKKDSSDSETKKMTYIEREEYPEYKASDYVDVSDKKYEKMKVEVALQSTDSLTDEQVKQSAITELPMQTVEGKAKDGDTVVIDYVGKIDGKEFDGGSATDYELELGSNSFIDGFEDALVGLKAGDKKDVNISFPDDYQQDSLKGKDAVFSVTVKSVKRDGELTDEYVKKNTDYDSVDAVLKHVKESLTESINSSNTNAVNNAVAAKLMEIYEDVKVPDELVSWYVNNSEVAYKEAAQYYDTPIDDYVSRYTNGSYKTMDDLKAYWKETAESQLGIEVVLRAIAEQEKTTISDETYKSLIDGYVSDYNMDSQKTFEKYYKVSNIKATMLANDVLETLCKEANVTNTSK